MKRISVTILFATLIVSLCAQVPEAFNYQAVVRNSMGEILANQDVTFRISILEDSEWGATIYAEKHNTITNNFGLVNLKIGMGEKLTGVFSPGGFGLKTHYIKVEMQISESSGFVELGVSQLLSVPYAFHAQTVEVDNTEDDDADPGNELQTISKSGQSIILSADGGSVIDEVEDADADPANELQTISKSGQSIILSSGGGSVADEVDDADADPSNELQVLSISNDTLFLSNGGYITNMVSYTGIAENLDFLTFDGNNWIAKNLLFDTDSTGEGMPVDIMQPYQVVNFIIALQGIFPSRNVADPFLATIVMFGGNFAPRGWAFCDGQLLSIPQNTALYSLLGTTFGGDGRTTFGLPDLRGRVPVHAGTGVNLTSRILGHKGGAEIQNITVPQLPKHNHNVIIQQ